MNVRRGLLAAAAGATVAVVLAGTASVYAEASASRGQVQKSVLPVRNHAHSSSRWGTNNLTYHSGPVEVGTVVYISYWGASWGSGFSTGGHTSSSAQGYVQDFFGAVGGSSWIGTDTQYCQGVSSGTVNCGANGTHVTNPPAQLAGSWNDTSAVPSNGQIQDSDVAAAAVRAVQHFGYRANATYLVFTPHGDSEGGFAANGGGWCAWHSDTSSTSGTVNYGYIPYMPDAGPSCGMNFVNGTSDAYGHGYFDGFSIVAGHEYEEAQTDPHLNAWYDRGGNEDADKCAWSSLSGNTSLTSTTNHWAVQPVWSNTISGCARVS